ncbi:putative Hexokinase [Leishmania shawi]
MLKTHTQGLATVAVDGSVYEKVPSFQRLYQECITGILGPTSNAKVVLQKDGSGVGAAMICALAANQK